MFNNTILGVIYMIKHKTDDTKMVYIGSSKNIKKRMTRHKVDCNNENNREYNFILYQYIRENDGFDNFEFKILECYVCNFKWELLDREDDYILTYGDMCLNEIRAFLTDEEIIERNKNNKKKYYENNREAIRLKAKEDYINNREIKLDQNKKSYEKHHNKRLIQMKEYREKNREIILEKKKELTYCECGGQYTKSHKARHINTIRHQEFIKNNVSK